MKYIPAYALLAVAALLLLFAVTGGDNSDNKALASLLIIPSGIFAFLAAIAALIAWWV